MPDSENFLKTLDTHQGIVYKVCRMYRDSKEDQDDLFQEIVLQLWKAFPDFRGESKVSSWIYRIALNTAIATFRKNKIVLEFKDILPVTLEEREEVSEKEVAMFEAFRKLNKAERAIIALYLEGYQYSEIGEIIGITENYVGVKMKRIKEKLKKIMS